ncbi:PTS sugar transporter subunit IIA [bacterium]|nr:PTS sugar transporter subunit IIA [bacterium]
MVKISDYLTIDFIATGLVAESKEEAINKILEITGKSENVVSLDKLRNEIFERESIVSTGIGYEVAIPHARLKDVRKLTACLGIFKDGVDFDSIDDKPVKIIFLVAAKNEEKKLYTQLVAKLGRFLIKQERREKLLSCRSSEEILDIIKDFDLNNH